METEILFYNTINLFIYSGYILNIFYEYREEF